MKAARILVLIPLLLSSSSGLKAQGFTGKWEVPILESLSKFGIDIALPNQLIVTEKDGELFVSSASNQFGNVRYEDIDFDEGDNILRFTQVHETQAGSREHQYKLKLENESFHLDISMMGSLPKRQYVVLIWYCTNHNPKHACNVGELKRCSEEYGCIF